VSVYYFGYPNADADERWQFWEQHRPAVVAIDIETISLDERHPLGIGIAFSPEESFYFDLTPEPPIKGLEALKKIISDIRIIKLAHNWVFDMGVFPLIPVIGNSLDRANIFDTNVAARLLGYQETSLPILSYEFGAPTESMKEILKRHGCKDNTELIKIDPMLLADHCQLDTKATYRLYMEWAEKIRQRFGEYFKVEMEVIPILLDISMHGIALDQEARQDLEDRYAKEVEFYGNMIKSYGVTNPGSPQQVGYVLAKRGNFLKLTKSKRQLRTRTGDLEFLDDPMAATVIGYRKKSKFLSTYLEPLAGEDRFYTEYYLDTSVGRLSSRNRNVQNIPGKDDDTGDPGARFMLIPDNRIFTTGDYAREHLYFLAHMCLHPDTKVLRTNLTWSKISDIKEGDTLIGIDEDIPKGSKTRKLRTTTVTKTSQHLMESFCIIFDNGTYVVSSGNHPWLRTNRPPTWKNQTHTDWIETKDIVPGTEIKFIGTPWETNMSRDAGYIAGLLDGEGSVSEYAVRFAQNPGKLSDSFVAISKSLGFEFSKASRHTWSISGLERCIRLLGSIRPARLLEKSGNIWKDKEPRTLSAKVIMVVKAGNQELINIETSTHTFIAEGLITHNSQDRNMLEVLYNPDPKLNDIHKRTADLMHTTRKLAKVCNYAVIYGATAQTLMEQLKTRDKRMCESMLEGWFRAYPGAADWIIYAQREGLRDGWSPPTLFGRRIRLPEESEDGMKRKAVNYPILGSDGEVIKRAIILCNHRRLGPPQMVITVHDSITWDGDVEKQIPKEELENIPGYTIPFEIKQTFRWE